MSKKIRDFTKKELLATLNKVWGAFNILSEINKKLIKIIERSK